MRNLLLMLMVTITMLSCSEQKKNEKRIYAFLKENLDDPKSYEPVVFGKIDTVFIPFDYHPKYKKLSNQLSNYKFNANYWTQKKDDPLASYLYKYVNVKDSAEFYTKKYKELKPKYDNAYHSYVEEIDYFIIYHKFRAKNKMGALILNEANFILDKNNMDIVDVRYIDR